MFRSSIPQSVRSRFVCAAAVAALTAGGASAEVVLVNLSDRPVFVARADYLPGRASTPAGGYSLPAEGPPGWELNGWAIAEPGGAFRGPPGNYYVEMDGRRVSWAGRREQPGMIRPAAFTNYRVGVADMARPGPRARADGFHPATYQHLDSGRYRIAGNAYRLSERAFDLDVQSLDRSTHTRTFTVPGRVVDVDPQLRRWPTPAPPIGRTFQGQSATLTVMTRGEQTRPLGPREPGYARGAVTVYYTEPVGPGPAAGGQPNPPPPPAQTRIGLHNRSQRTYVVTLAAVTGGRWVTREYRVAPGQNLLTDLTAEQPLVRWRYEGQGAEWTGHIGAPNRKQFDGRWFEEVTVGGGVFTFPLN